MEHMTCVRSLAKVCMTRRRLLRYCANK